MPTHTPRPIDASMEKNDDHPGRRHARPAPDEYAKDQRHEQKACRQKDHLAADRGFNKGPVDHDRTDDAKVYAGEPLFRLRSDRSGEFGYLFHSLQQVLFRHFDGDVYNADIAVPGQNAACDTRVGRCNVTDARPRFGPGQISRIDKIPYMQIVAVGGRVLKIGERVDAPRIRSLPGGFCQPDGRRKGDLRRGVTIVRNDQERDIVVFFRRYFPALRVREAEDCLRRKRCGSWRRIREKQCRLTRPQQRTA